MKTPLVPIDILSIYRNKFNDLVPLPVRMALCTPDTYSAIFNIAGELAGQKGKLILSDLFRSYDMQAQAHHDFLARRKKDFSPPPGGSFHEAGRAFDIDLSAIKVPLDIFWSIAQKYGVVPIISQPLKNKSEAWHFECRGSHQIVYQYYKEGMGKNFKPYTAAAISAILSIGVNVDAFAGNQKQAALQSCLIRLGEKIGNIDGHIGKNTQEALVRLGIEFDINNIDKMLIQAENLLQGKFPEEFSLPVN